MPARGVGPPSYAGRAMADPATYRPAPGSIPEEPGVYRFSDAAGRVIYVGKAKSLRSRLNSYFADLANLHPRTRQMVTSAARVQWTVVGTEVEALQLEYNWIKEFDPRFNVRYRDDKTYPVLAVTVGEEFPRLHVYRGPRARACATSARTRHAWAIRETLDLLLRVFPARTCSAGVFRRHGQIGRPCLLGYIDKCSAPCVGRVSADEHRDIVDDFCDFLSGRTDRMMRRAGTPHGARPPRSWSSSGRPGCATISARCAGPWRSQAVVLGDGTDADVVAFAAGRAGGRGAGVPRARRPGPRPARLGDRQGRADRDARAWSSGSSPSSTASRRRSRSRRTTRASPCRARSSCPSCPPDVDALAEWLCAAARLPGADPRAAARRQAGAGRDRRAQRQGGVRPAQAAPGRRSHGPLGGAAGDPGRARARQRTAAHRVRRRLARAGHRRRRLAGGVRGRAGAQVGLPALRDPRGRRRRRRRRDRRGHPQAVPPAPGRNAGGTEAGGNGRGRPADSGDIDPSTDTADGTPGHRSDHRPAAQVRLPAEPVRRRRRRPAGRRRPRTCWPSSGSPTSRSCGLAKRLEEVWLPADPDPVILPRTSEGLYLLQRVRDEAHRFAITYHRRSGPRAMTASALDGVPGLGETRTQGAARHFGSAPQAAGRAASTRSPPSPGSGVGRPRGLAALPDGTTLPPTAPAPRRTRRASIRRRPSDARRADELSTRATPASRRIEVTLGQRPVRRRPQHRREVPGGPRLLRRRQPAAGADRHDGRPRSPRPGDVTRIAVVMDVRSRAFTADLGA